MRSRISAITATRISASVLTERTPDGSRANTIPGLRHFLYDVVPPERGSSGPTEDPANAGGGASAWPESEAWGPGLMWLPGPGGSRAVEDSPEVVDDEASSSGPAQRARARWAQAGLRPITLQECRHTAATWLDAAGVSPKVSSVLMGHAAPQRQAGAAQITLERYTHALPEDIEGARRQLAEYLAGSQLAGRVNDFSVPRTVPWICASPRLRAMRGVRRGFRDRRIQPLCHLSGPHRQ
jgi:hypothetical protein